MENILYLFLGWFLRLFSPKIIEHIQRPYRIKEIRDGIFSELTEVKHRIAMNVHTLSPQYHPLEKSDIIWLLPFIEEYEKLYLRTHMSENLKKLLDYDERDFKAAMSHKNIIDPTPGYRLNRYLLPFLESQIRSLAMFDLDFQKDIMKVKANISLLNEQINNSRFYFDKTFEKLSDNNPNIIKGNLSTCYSDIARMSKKTANEIDHFVSKYKNKYII